MSTLIRAAGGVVCQRDGDEWFAVVVAPDGDAWRLPKGIVEVGESDETAALREVAEETGLTTEIRTPLSISRWRYEFHGRDVEKVTQFFLMVVTGGSLADRDHHEIPHARWVKLIELDTRLFYESEQAVAREAQSLLLGTTRTHE